LAIHISAAKLNCRRLDVWYGEENISEQLSGDVRVVKVLEEQRNMSPVVT